MICRKKLSANSLVFLILKEPYNCLAFVETRNRLKLHIEPTIICRLHTIMYQNGNNTVYTRKNQNSQVSLGIGTERRIKY